MNRWCEAHAHIGQYGAALAMIDLSAAANIGEVLDLLARHAATKSEHEWVVGHALRVEGLDQRRWPTIAELDDASGGRPCVVMSFDHHAVVAGSAALAHSGLTEQVPEGGLVERDRHGDLTGVAYETAAKAIWASMPAPTDQERRSQVVAGIRALADLGAVEIHDLLTDIPLLDALVDLDADGALDELGVTVRMYVPAQALSDPASSRHAMTRLEGASTRLKLGGAKIFVDGTLNGRTAWMLEPYENPHPSHPRGMAIMDDAALRDVIARCDARGLPVAAHAIGDAAVRAVLDAIEEVSPRTRGFRIEHAEIVDEADVARFAKLGVTCSLQPCHLLVDVEALNRYLPHRLERVLPLRDLIDAGCAPGEGLIFGSDVPIVRANPEDSILAATTRARADMAPADAIAPAQAITDAEARACFSPSVSPQSTPL